MFKNFIVSAFRNMRRNKFYSFLNILGLSVGIAAFIFILLYIRDELTYDKYNTKYERIYRLESNFNVSNKVDRFAIVPIPMGPAFKLEFPEVESFVRFQGLDNTLVKYGNKEYYEENLYFADSTVFDIFDVDFIYGRAKNSLTEPFTIVLTEKLAKKYFGDKDPIGEVLEINAKRSYKVTGVIRNLPSNTHLKYDGLVSASSIEQIIGAERFNSMEPIRFWNIGVYTYVLLKENSSMESVYEKFPAFYEKYMKPIGDQINASFDLIYTPLAETHFKGGLSADKPTGSMAYIYIFSAVALFILLLAMINYMNMATARSANRAREVGLRKVVGAQRTQLIWQFIGESLIMAFIALIIAVVIVSALLPDFDQLAGKSITFSQFLQPGVLFLIIGITLVIGIVSGSYPAFYLSSFKPVTVLKGKTGGNQRSSGMLRRILVVIQFFIAIVMIIATLVVNRQLNYLKNKDLGFKKENLVVLELQDSTFRSKAPVMKQELLQNPDILAVSNTVGVPSDINWIQVMRVESEDKMVEQTLILNQADFDFIRTMGMEIVQGRDFDPKMGTDSTSAVIINQACAKALGWEDNPIGKKIDYGINLEGNADRPLKVIGVVKDFNFKSLHNKIDPIIIFISRVPRATMVIRTDGKNTAQTLSFIEEKWHEFGAKRPFNYKYLDQMMDESYTSEATLGVIFRITSILTIFIALLGLLGLSSFIAEQKNKEIGIRKVLGASVGSVLQLLYKEFVLLILIAFVIAIPVAWWRLDIWLQDSFVYHTNLTLFSFLLAGLIALVIGLGTISYHIVKAASGNPVDAIKYE